MAAPNRIQATTGTTGNTFPTSLTTSAFGSSTKSGSMILVAVMADGLAASTLFTVTDTASNTYSRVATTNVANTDQVDIWVCYRNNGGASHTITAGNLGNTTAAIVAEEWSPSLGMVDVSKVATDVTGTSTAITTGASAVPSYNTGIVWVAAASASSTANYTVGAGFSNLTSVTSNPSKLGVESAIILSGGAQTGLMTLSVGATWLVAMVVIPPNGSKFEPYFTVGNGMSRSETAN